MIRQITYVAVLLILIPLTDCGGGGASPAPTPPPPPPSTITSVFIANGPLSDQEGQQLRFVPVVQGTGNFSTELTWSVNGVTGGDAINGTASASGVYTAPAALPPTNPVTVTAASVQDPTKSGSATVTIFTLAISPTNVTVFYNHTQQFTASLTGITNPSLVWITTRGTIDANGLYTAPQIIVPNVTDMACVNVSNAGSHGVCANITLQIPPPVLTSITPNGASANEGVKINGRDLIDVTHVFFSGQHGSTLDAPILQQPSTSQIKVDVPLGTVTGPLYITEQPAGVNSTSNNINFTRLPNLRIRGSTRDLSSGESLQFTYRLLGASNANAVTWTTNLGNISNAGLYQAPTVSQETFATVTGCLQNTRSCDSAMLRIAPLRITPSAPVVSMGQNLQLNAVAGSPISANWAVVAGGGSVTSTGLFTAPTNPVQAGGVPVSATAGSASDIGSVAVSGAFPGLVSRTYDYMNFGIDPQRQRFLQQMEGTRVRNLAVSGNRAYTLDEGIRSNPPFDLNPPFTAIETYDISNPRNPAWLSAAESVSDHPSLFSTYSHYLFLVEVGQIPGSQYNPPSRIVLYDIQSNTPQLLSSAYVPDLYSAHDNNGMIYCPPLNPYTGPTVPIYVFDVTSGTIQQAQIDLPAPSGADASLPPYGVIGTGSLLYAEFQMQDGSADLAAYDTSVSPPNLLATVPITGSFSGVNMLIRGNQLLIGNTIFDISNQVPVQLGTVSVQDVQDVQGTQLLGRGFLPIYAGPDNYVVADITNPANPVLTTSVYDIRDDYYSPTARFVANGRMMLTNEGVGGIAATDLSATGGQIDKTRLEVFPSGFIFDHAIMPQTLYVAGASGLGSGGLLTFDLSGGTPVFSGVLLYGQDEAFAVRVSNSKAFLGLKDSLRTIDVSNPATPVETGSLALPTNALALSGNMLFDGTTDGRLVALNVTNANSPSILGTVFLPGPAVNLRLAGNTLFVADGPAGLLLFDVSNPAVPVQLSKVSLSDPVWDVTPSGTLAFLAADSLGLVILDISNPMQPKQLSQATLDSWSPFPCFHCEGPRSIALAVTVQNGLVYVGTANSLGLVFGFDYAQPKYPRLVSMNAYGEFVDTLISGFSFLGNDIWVFGALGVQDDAVQADNSVPRNAINLYYPPLALRSITFLTTQSASARTKMFVHPKFDRQLFQRQHRYPGDYRVKDNARVQ